MKLERARRAWGTGEFSRIFCEELKENSAFLDLQKRVSATSVALESGIEVMFIGAREEQDGRISVKAGIFFEGIISGCSCADDPTPVEPQPEYCEMEFEIDENGESLVREVEDGMQH